MKWAKRIIFGTIGALVVFAIVWAYLPKPVPVELGTVRRAPFESSVSEAGRTRVKDRYTVSAAVGGTVQRIALRAGDAVARGPVLARIVSLDPPLLDARTRAQAQARVRAAEAGREQATTQVERARTLLEFARGETVRQRELAQSGSATTRAVEVAEVEERSRAKELSSAQAAREVAAWELDNARAALRRLQVPGPGPQASGESIEIRAPVAGTVLRVMQESEGPVLSGAPLLEVGDLSALEVLVELLTQDAVRVARGAEVAIERWGGGDPLSGHVRRVEPSAVTKLSALGVEEQRVNVLVDLDDAPAVRALGDGFRVEARITLFRAPEVLQVPGSALFRSGDSWAVFVADGERARLRLVTLGHRNDEAAEVISGLSEGDRVLLHPGDAVRDGVRYVHRVEEPARV